MNELLEEVKGCVGKIFEEQELDDLFYKYDWICMGFNRDKSKLTYIEGPMDREIDLIISMLPGRKIFVRDYKKLYF